MVSDWLLFSIDPNSLFVGNAYYIADSTNNRIRKIQGGIMTTIAGTGTAGYSGDNGLATSANLNDPRGVITDTSGNIYIADTKNHRIRKITINDNKIYTLAGSGLSGVAVIQNYADITQVALSYPDAVTLDTSANIYIVNTGVNQIIRLQVYSSPTGQPSSSPTQPSGKVVNCHQ